jgi:hypothetical protein
MKRSIGHAVPVTVAGRCAIVANRTTHISEGMEANIRALRLLLVEMIEATEVPTVPTHLLRDKGSVEGG